MVDNEFTWKRTACHCWGTYQPVTHLALDPHSWGCQELRRTKNISDSVSITKEHQNSHPWENYTPWPCLTLDYQPGIVGVLKFLGTFSSIRCFGFKASSMVHLLDFLCPLIIFTCIHSHAIYFSWDCYLLSFHNVMGRPMRRATGKGGTEAITGRIWETRWKPGCSPRTSLCWPDFRGSAQTPHA